MLTKTVRFIGIKIINLISSALDTFYAFDHGYRPNKPMGIRYEFNTWSAGEVEHFNKVNIMRHNRWDEYYPAVSARGPINYKFHK